MWFGFWAAAILGGGTFLFIHPVLGIFVAGFTFIGCACLSADYDDKNITKQTTNEQIGEHRCCIQCRQPTERLG